MPWSPSAPTTSPPRHQGGTAASVLTHEPGVLLCPLRCPPVSFSMSSYVFICSLYVMLYFLLLCLHMFPSCAIHYILLCIPRCSSVSSLISSCVTMCTCVFSCLHPVPSYARLLCLPISFSLVLLCSPLNVPLCLLAIILSSLVPSFMLLFCVHDHVLFC